MIGQAFPHLLVRSIFSMSGKTQILTSPARQKAHLAGFPDPIERAIGPARSRNNWKEPQDELSIFPNVASNPAKQR
jgi:hypothetical protein